MIELPQEPSREGQSEIIIWVFNGERAALPCGVFQSLECAEKAIAGHKLSGMLTGYPSNAMIYDWALQKGYWSPKVPSHHAPEFIQRFTSAYLEHYHYRDGINEAQCT